jgi:hypothetical protein
MPLRLTSEGRLMEQDTLFEPITSEQEDEQEALPVYEILTYPADYTLEVLVEKWEKGQIIVPSLQRGYVWTQVQASKLIESFLLGLPVPPVFLYQRREDNSLLVIDGHQRLKTIFYFFEGLFGEPTAKGTKVFTLTGFNDKSPYIGQTYQSLNENNKQAFNRLNNSVLRAFLMKQIEPVDDSSIIQVFERLNSGGVALNGQEIRNCLYDGSFLKMLKKINKFPEWRTILGRKHVDARMRDVELVLRLIALSDDLANYKHPMKQFLNGYLRLHKAVKPDEEKRISEQFREISRAVVQSLGERPFHIHRGLNAAVCDSVFVSFIRHSNDWKSKLEGMKDRFQELVKQTTYGDYTTKATTNDEVVPKRIDLADKALFGSKTK